MVIFVFKGRHGQWNQSDWRWREEFLLSVLVRHRVRPLWDASQDRFIWRLQVQVSTIHSYLNCTRYLFVFVFLNLVYFLASRYCSSCVRTNERKEQEMPRASEALPDQDNDSKALYNMAYFKGLQFKVGDGVYLPPDAFNFGWGTWFKTWNFSKLVWLGICPRLIALFCLRSVWSQRVQWSAPTGRKMWMKSCIQNITGSHQTTLRGQTWMLPSLSALGASRRSSVTGAATGSPMSQRSNCDSTSSTGKNTLEWLVTGLNPEWRQLICKELTGFCLIYQAWEHSQRCQSQLPYRHQPALLEWWRSDCWHVRGARTLSSWVRRRLEWISPGLFQWWTRPLLFPGGTVVIQNFRLAYWHL